MPVSYCQTIIYTMSAISPDIMITSIINHRILRMRFNEAQETLPPAHNDEASLPVPPEKISPILRKAFQEQYQREVRASRRVVMWATILSLGLAISSVLLMYKLIITG